MAVEKLSRTYYGEGTETRALRDATLTVHDGEYLSIVGASGSGKSTLLHLLGLLDRPTSGKYYLDGLDTTTLSDEELAHTRNTRLGFVFQSFHLLPRASVLENVLLPLQYSAIPVSEHSKLAKAAIASVEMDHRTHHRPDQLSGGEKQRTAIARALVNNPQILFADEPTGNLDSKTGATVMNLLDSLHNKGRTILVITHDQEAATYAERTLRLHDGEIVEEIKNAKHPHE